MAKTDITKNLEHGISIATSKMGTFGCFEVTIGFSGNERVDYMTIDTKGIWKCYEIKCSFSDFRSKAKKTFVGHYNYYVMTTELYEKVKDEIPKHIGVYVGDRYVKSVKRAVKQELQVEKDVLLMSMIRSLSRDAEKYNKFESPQYAEQMKRLADHYKGLYKTEQRRRQDIIDALYKKFGRDWYDLVEEWGNLK